MNNTAIEVIVDRINTLYDLNDNHERDTRNIEYKIDQLMKEISAYRKDRKSYYEKMIFNKNIIDELRNVINNIKNSESEKTTPSVYHLSNFYEENRCSDAIKICLEFLHKKERILGIKALREKFGWGLKDAKDYIESYGIESGLTHYDACNGHVYNF